MKLFSKKEECIHHWHYVGKSTVYQGNSCDVDVDEMNALFCPKCETETVVSDERWTQLQAIQKVRESYHQPTIVETATVATKTARRRGAAPA